MALRRIDKRAKEGEKNMIINFIGKRYYFFALSALFIILGIVSFVRNDGLNYDIQFQGGTLMQFEMEHGDFEPNKASNILSDALDKIVTVRKSETGAAGTGDESDSNIFLMLDIAERERLSDEERNLVTSIVRGENQEYDLGEEFAVVEGSQVSINMVDPSIGEQLKQNAIWAVVISAILIILYIWLRFSAMSGLSAGLMAIVALLHDILIMFSVYTIFNLPINESFIAAVLTIIGYSMNDTVVIYDRIRENSSLLRKTRIRELVNKSITQCLPRTINTTFAVLLSVSMVFIFATMANVQSIREFSFPLMIGVLSGTYSSIFVATPLYVMLKEHSLKSIATGSKK